jgi:hypothetical protein
MSIRLAIGREPIGFLGQKPWDTDATKKKTATKKTAFPLAGLLRFAIARL